MGVGTWVSVEEALPENNVWVTVKLLSGSQKKMLCVDGNWFDCHEFFWDDEEDPVVAWKR